MTGFTLYLWNDGLLYIYGITGVYVSLECYTAVSHSYGLQTYGRFTLWSIFTGDGRNMFKIVSIFWLIQLQVTVSSFREHPPLISP